jgi:hypothetical protein
MTVEQARGFLSELNRLIDKTPIEVLHQAKENVHIRRRRPSEPGMEALWVTLEAIVSACINAKALMI